MSDTKDNKAVKQDSTSRDTTINNNRTFSKTSTGKPKPRNDESERRV